ncbi:phosphotransferase [Streptomyces sp. NPDC004435]|uniref:phosphotransferase n=1 Tax=Streptomyces sp. NPDC004435 TaxID=3364701 RepID=UPI0036B36A11
MDTLLLGGLPPTTVELLRTAPWMEESARRAGRFELVDEALLGSVRLLIVTSAGGDGTGAGIEDGAGDRTGDGTGDATGRWFVPVADRDDAAGAGGTAADRTDAYDRLVVGAMRDGLRLPTRRGNVVEFRGEPAEYRGQLPFEPGWSSNALSLIDLAGAPHAHKSYRRIGAGTREPELLRLMADSGRTQRPVGEYAYVDTSTGAREPLGVLYRYAEGDGLNVPLRESIRAMWPLLAAGADPHEAVAVSQRALVAPLREAGAFLRGFHHDLAERLGPHVEFPSARFRDWTAERLAALRPQLLADARFPVAVREAAVAGLERELARAAALPPRPWPAGPCHGDLHLSHLLRSVRPDGGWDLCVIDLSTPHPDPADPATAQSPWQDLAAMQRGLEIFTADEFSDHAADVLGKDSEDTCRTALLTAAGSRPDTPGWTDRDLAELARLQAAANLWATRTGELLITEGQALTDHPAWRVFRLRRLIHELDYAYAHDRGYHAAINLRHAVEAPEPRGAGAED